MAEDNDQKRVMVLDAAWHIVATGKIIAIDPLRDWCTVLLNRKEEPRKVNYPRVRIEVIE